VKKAIAIGTGSADIDTTAKFDLSSGTPYAISKAAMNKAIAKCSAKYREQGVIFISIAPGLVSFSIGRKFRNPLTVAHF
jgi:NAD(P)-dependent dehydrogenase (short-subunit alcohol dehydrogenase family)